MTGKSRALHTYASQVRSRRAGQSYFEIDVIFRDLAVYNQTKDSGRLTVTKIAALYKTVTSDVVGLEWFDAGQTLHVVLRRPKGRSSGDIGDTDVSGSLQYMPIANCPVDWLDDDNLRN